MMAATTIRACPERADHLGNFKFLSIGRSHVGCVRTLNEDSFLNRPEKGVWAVADGMGGHEGGELASARVVEALDGIGACANAYALRDGATSALQMANEDLVSRGRELFGGAIGSTVVTLLAYRGHYACMWAGDSRIYLYRAGQIRLLTRDHSYVQEMVDAGVLGAGEARLHPKSNVITRAVGARASLELDAAYGDIRDGDRFLLCSDGLSSVLAEREIAAELNRAPAELAADGLISRALARGAADNVTVVIVIAAEL
ncbi:MAG: PP2C family serine/threonine-protein phosphatase [Hyphomonadaceae bacterium]